MLNWNNPPTGDAGTRKRGVHPVSLSTSWGVYVGQFELASEIFSFIPGIGEILAAVTKSGNLQLLQPGDSGGPLINDTTVCGINSRVYPPAVACHPIMCDPIFTTQCAPFPVLCQMYVENHHTTVDSFDKREFILAEIADPTGTRFRGICDEGETWLRDVDTDGDLIPDGCDRCPTQFDADYDISPLPDDDLDGVPDRCDNCPNVYNPPSVFLINGQVTHWPQFDSDGDGRGNACDWDPWTSFPINDAATNTNLEAEIVAYYPELDHAPTLVTTQAGAITYRQAFRAGRDEPVPTPRFKLGWGFLPSSLSAIHGKGIDPLDPASNCLPPTTCTIALLNRIWPQPAVPEIPPGTGTFTHPATGRLGSVGTFWCPCGKDRELGGTPTDRLKCRNPLTTNCMPTQINLNSNGTRWRRAHLTGVPSIPYEQQTSPPADWTWPPTTLDRTYQFINGTTPPGDYWDFTYLGNGCADPDNPGELVCIEGYTGAIGVLWNNLRNMSGLTHSGFSGVAGEPVTEEMQRQRGGDFWSGYAGYHVEYNSNEVKWAQPIPSGLEWPCWLDGCPPEIFDPTTVMLIDPSTVFANVPAHLPPETHPAELMVGAISSAKGSLRMSSGAAFGGAATILHQAALEPDRLYVAASEPPAQLAHRSSQPIQLRAIVLRKSTAQPIQMVTQIGSSGAIEGLNLRVPEPDLPPTLPPEIRPLSVTEFDAKHPQHDWICPKLAKLGAGSGSSTDLVRDADGVALSALRNELLVFGGFTAGAPAPTARVLSLTGSWEEIALDAGERPGNVLAAAYHFADDAYYEVDQLGAATLLRRFSPVARTFQTIAKLPATWNNMDRNWLVSGLDGDLYFVGARDKLSILARFVPGADGALAFAGTRVYPHTVLTRPIAGYGRLVVVRAPDQKELSGKGKPGQSYMGGPVRETLRVSEFHPSPGWAPIIVGG